MSSSSPICGDIGAVVLAVGSPFGCDRVAWLAAERLERAGLGPGVRVRCLDRPGPALLEHLRGVEVAVVIDALLGGEPGDIRRVEPERLLAAGSGCSSHGLGVAETLVLGAALGDLPRRLAVLGIGVGDDPAAALPRVDWARLLAMVRGLLRDDGTR